MGIKEKIWSIQMGEPHCQDSKCFTVYGKLLWAFSPALPGSILCRTSLGWCSTIVVFICSCAPKRFEVPFPSFYPYPWFLNELFPIRTEIRGNVVEISPLWNGTSLCNPQMSSNDVIGLRYDWTLLTTSNIASSTVVSSPGSLVISTMPFAIYLMEI